MLRLHREEVHSGANQLRQIFRAKPPLKVEAGIDHGLVVDAELLGVLPFASSESICDWRGVRSTSGFNPTPVPKSATRIARSSLR
jgi:hypothetical protein